MATKKKKILYQEKYKKGVFLEGGNNLDFVCELIKESISVEIHDRTTYDDGTESMKITINVKSN